MLPRNVIIIYLGRGLLGGNSIAHKPINQTDPSSGTILLPTGELKILSSGEELIVSRNTLHHNAYATVHYSPTGYLTHTLVRVRSRIMREEGGRGKEGEENGREWGKGTEEGKNGEKAKTEDRGKLRRKEYEKKG